MTEPIKYESEKLLEVFITVKVIKVIDQQEFSQYTIIWNNGTDVQEQKKEFLEPKTDGAAIILLGIQDILKACPQDQPIVITITHKRMFHALKNGCVEVEGTEEYFDILKPHMTKIRDMILSRKADVFVRKPKKLIMFRVLDSINKDESSITTHLQTPAIVGSSSSSTQQQLGDDSSVAPPSRTSAFTPVMQQQQVTDSSVAPPSRISAFTPVVSGYTPSSSITSPTSIESHNQLLRSPYEQMPSEHGVYTTSNENQVCTYSSTIVQKQQQEQGSRPVRRSKRLNEQRKKIEEDSKRGLQSQEAVGSSSSLLNEAKSKNVETNTQQIQEGSIETSSLSSSLAVNQLLIPSADGNKHVTITDKQKDELIWARKIPRSPSKTRRKIIKNPFPKAQHGHSNVLTKKQTALLRYSIRREKVYQEHVKMRKEHLEINRWFDSMEKDDHLKVRRTFNAYNNIPLEKTLNEEERKVIEEEERKGTNERKRKAICLDHTNQQKQGEEQSSNGIFTSLLKKIGLGKE